MKKLEAVKDGNGNIIITEDSFDYLLLCLDNQKFIQNTPHSQKIIDEYNNECRKILHQKYIFETCEDDYFLYKRYKYQDNITPWSVDDLAKVYELFKETKMVYKNIKKIKPLNNDLYKDGDSPCVDENGWIILEQENRPWLIERPLRYDNQYLTISEDGQTNRPWKKEEIIQICNKFNSYEYREKDYYKEELWKDQLSKMNPNIIEQYIRKLKIQNL